MLLYRALLRVVAKGCRSTSPLRQLAERSSLTSRSAIDPRISDLIALESPYDQGSQPDFQSALLFHVNEQIPLHRPWYRPEDCQKETRTEPLRRLFFQHPCV